MIYIVMLIDKIRKFFSKDFLTFDYDDIYYDESDEINYNDWCD